MPAIIADYSQLPLLSVQPNNHHEWKSCLLIY